MIKIITGIKRCGKSVILRQIMSEIEKGGKRCLFLDSDLRPGAARIPDADALIACVNEYLGNDKLYVFLDEIQNADGWNNAVRTLRLYNTSVFITGSYSETHQGLLIMACICPARRTNIMHHCPAHWTNET